MYVYRVENSEGKGCYQMIDSCDVSFRWTIHNHGNRKKNPNIWNDFDNLPPRDQFVCGFNKLAQFYMWFLPPELEKLQDYQFHLSIYRLKHEYKEVAADVHIRKGSKQCLFNKHYYELFVTLPLTKASKYGLEKKYFTTDDVEHWSGEAYTIP